MRFLIKLLLVNPIKPRAMLEASLLIPLHSSVFSFYVLMKKKVNEKILLGETGMVDKKLARCLKVQKDKRELGKAYSIVLQKLSRSFVLANRRFVRLTAA